MIINSQKCSTKNPKGSLFVSILRRLLPERAKHPAKYCFTKSSHRTFTTYGRAVCVFDRNLVSYS